MEVGFRHFIEGTPTLDGRRRREIYHKPYYVFRRKQSRSPCSVKLACVTFPVRKKHFPSERIRKKPAHVGPSASHFALHCATNPA